MIVQPRYFLRDKVFVCFADGYCVFLDLRTDNYLCVQRKQIDQLDPWLYSAQRQPGISPAEPPPEEVYTFANALINRGLITSDEHLGREFSATSVPKPHSSASMKIGGRLTSFAILHAPAFLLASRRANRALRTQPLEETIRKLELRKAQYLKKGGKFDAERATPLINAFYMLRPYFPRNYLCLFDSLALLEYLAIYKLFPTWVFGVQTDPFSAHCWLQEGELLLNDTIDLACTYTPVMAV